MLRYVHPSAKLLEISFQVLEDWSRSQHEVVSLMRSANSALSEMFDHYTVSEWIEQKLYPIYSKLSSIRSQADDLRRIKYWPSRHIIDIHMINESTKE